MAQVSVFSLGGIGAPCCCGGGTPTRSCIPCTTAGQGFPETNLTLSWVNPIFGNGSTPLIYDASAFSWTSTVGSTFCTFDGLIGELVCTGGNIELKIHFWTAGSCAGGLGSGTSNYCSNLRSPNFQLTLAAGYTCSPLNMTFDCRSAGCPSLTLSGFTEFILTP